MEQVFELTLLILCVSFGLAVIISLCCYAHTVCCQMYCDDENNYLIQGEPQI